MINICVIGISLSLSPSSLLYFVLSLVPTESKSLKVNATPAIRIDARRNLSHVLPSRDTRRKKGRWKHVIKVLWIAPNNHTRTKYRAIWIFGAFLSPLQVLFMSCQVTWRKNESKENKVWFSRHYNGHHSYWSLKTKRFKADEINATQLYSTHKQRE